MANIDRIFLRFDSGKGQICISRGSTREMRKVLTESAAALKAIHSNNTDELAFELNNMTEQLEEAEKTWQRRENTK